MTSISFGHTNSGLQVGINQGSIYMTQGDRSEPRPEPISTVPFPHDPDFVGRNEILEQIHEKGSIAGSRLALVGLGGVGKTQLAIEYCHQVRQHSADTWIFWVHASNAARCEKSLRDLADRAKIPESQDRNANIFQVVGNWLHDEKIGRWILVLDNIDDDELLREPSAIGTASQMNTATQPPLRYLFESSNGSIVVTTRNRVVALNVASHKNIIEVQPMSQAEGLDLLQKKLSTPTEHNIIVQLARELEFMPLAIVQAASYITHRLPRCSVSQYLEKIQGDRDAVRMLNEEAGLLYRDWEAKNSILLTWQISFDYIRGKRSAATDLLSLMSFFNWQGITEDIIRVQQNQTRDKRLSPEQLKDSLNEQDTDDESDNDADDEFEKNITTLCDFSLIAVGEDSISFTMHRLVQLTVRTWLKTHGQLEQWKGLFIESLYSKFPTGEYENWERCRSLFPHVKAAVSQRPKSPVSVQQWATLLYRGAWYAQESGHITESIRMAFRSRKYRLELFGIESEAALDSTAMLAVAYRLEGRWKEAEQLGVQVMETRKTKLGGDHPDTLTSMGNLASTYRSQGRWEEAKEIEVQVMETRKTKLGADHPDTLTSMANFASTYWSHGRWEEAEQLLVQVIEKSKTKLGAEHPDTLTSMNNLAMTYSGLGRWEKAEQLLVHVMETRKTKLSADHPSMLTSISNLAMAYMNQGRWEEAEQLLVQVTETRKMKLGAEHPDTLISMGNLASTYWNQGRWDKAEQLELQVMKSRKTKLSVDHPDTLTSMNNLAMTYMNQGRWEEAEQLLVQVMNNRKTKLGTDHPDTLSSMANLAFTLESTGRRSEAIDLLGTCVTKQQRILGSAHPNTVSNSDTLLAWESGDLAIKT